MVNSHGFKIVVGSNEYTPPIVAMAGILRWLAGVEKRLMTGAEAPPRVLEWYHPTPDEEELHERIYALLEKLREAFRREGVAYWAVGGTLLGAVRHRGAVPWDDDADVGVWAADVARAERAVRRHIPGADWQTNLRAFAVVDRAHPNAIVDVFPFAVDADGWARFSNPLAAARWPDEFFAVGDVEAARETRFGSTSVPVPARPCEYLDRAYAGWDAFGHVVRHKKAGDGTDGAYVRLPPGASRAWC